jgi:hypothetical protein
VRRQAAQTLQRRRRDVQGVRLLPQRLAVDPQQLRPPVIVVVLLRLGIQLFLERLRFVLRVELQLLRLLVVEHFVRLRFLRLRFFRLRFLRLVRFWFLWFRRVRFVQFRLFVWFVVLRIGFVQLVQLTCLPDQDLLISFH